MEWEASDNNNNVVRNECVCDYNNTAMSLLQLSSDDNNFIVINRTKKQIIRDRMRVCVACQVDADGFDFGQIYCICVCVCACVYAATVTLNCMHDIHYCLLMTEEFPSFDVEFAPAPTPTPAPANDMQFSVSNNYPSDMNCSWGSIFHSKLERDTLANINSITAQT